MGAVERVPKMPPRRQVRREGRKKNKKNRLIHSRHRSCGGRDLRDGMSSNCDRGRGEREREKGLQIPFRTEKGSGASKEK